MPAPLTVKNETKRRGRPALGGGDNPLRPGLKIAFPVSLLACVDAYLIHCKQQVPGPYVLSRSEGIRQLIDDALDVWRRPETGGDFVAESMPHALLADSHTLVLSLYTSTFQGVEEYRDHMQLGARVTSIRDLLWNGLRIWSRRKEGAATKRRPDPSRGVTA